MGRAVLQLTLPVDAEAGVALSTRDGHPGVEALAVVQTFGLWSREQAWSRGGEEDPLIPSLSSTPERERSRRGRPPLHQKHFKL